MTVLAFFPVILVFAIKILWYFLRNLKGRVALDKKSITRALKLTFICSFLVSFGASVAWIIGLGATQTPGYGEPIPVELLVLLIASVSGLVYLVSLGKIAHRLGHNWLVWCVCATLGGTLTMLITFLLMLYHVRSATQPAPASE